MCEALPAALGALLSLLAERSTSEMMDAWMHAK
jgi:hypothetical protein